MVAILGIVSTLAYTTYTRQAYDSRRTAEDGDGNDAVDECWRG